MSKLLLSVLVLALASLCASQEVFLASDDFSFENVLAIENVKQVDIAPLDVLAFLKGFNNGLEIFANLPGEKECAADGKVVVSRVIKIVSLAKELVETKDYIRIIGEITQEVLEIVKYVQETAAECKTLVEAVKSDLQQIGAYVAKDDYATRLQAHLLSNLFPIMSKVNTLVEAFKTQNFAAAGNGAGELINLIAFWDYKFQQ